MLDSRGLVDWWPGDGNANDIVGTNNGTATSVVYGIGEVGRDFEFNGVNSQVSFGPTAGNFGTNDFTIEFWANNPTNEPDGVGFLQKRVPGALNAGFMSLRFGDASHAFPPGIINFELNDGVTEEGLHTTTNATMTACGIFRHHTAKHEPFRVC